MEQSLTCREFVEFLADYLDGRLPEIQLVRFNDHLARCPACVNYARTYQQAVRLGRAAILDGEDPAPSDAPPDLVRAILAARSAKA
jgi:anti-sigma factor RsiW